MLRLLSTRPIISRVPAWRCLQQRTPSARKVQSLTPPRLLPPVAASTGSLLNARAVNWLASRLCHGDSQGSADRGDPIGSFSLKSISQAPKPALYLGVSGFFHFPFVPFFMVATQAFSPEIAFVQMVYGASIVSFLGGARWWFTLPAGSPARPDWSNLGNSVVPSLVAWLALLCRDNITEGILAVMMGLGLSMYYDLILLPGYPSWFKAMRNILTLVATFSLVATIVIKQFFPTKKFKAVNN